MKAILALANAFALTSTAFATDHGPVFGYATPVNSQGEVSCDTSIYGRNSPGSIREAFVPLESFCPTAARRPSGLAHPCSPF